MPKIHIVAQAKGGSGKTTAASFIAQYLFALDKTPRCFDADPLNKSFASYTAFQVQSISVLNANNDIEVSSWDALTHQLCATPVDAVVDIGATSFISIMRYINEVALIELLSEYKHSVCMHIPVAGGESLSHTLSGMGQIIDQFESSPASFAIWLNPFWGPIEWKGESFEALKDYTSRKDRISAIIRIPDFPNDLHGQDLKKLFANNMTFAEALHQEMDPKNPDSLPRSVHGFSIATLQRYKQMQRDVFRVMELANIFG